MKNHELNAEIERLSLDLHDARNQLQVAWAQLEAIGAGGVDQKPHAGVAAPQEAPSDAEIDAIWREGALRKDCEPSIRGQFRWAARALLARYGAQPASNEEPWGGHKFKKHSDGTWRCADGCGPVLIEAPSPVKHWPDGTPRDERDISSDPGGTLIHDPSKPLYAAPVAAQPQPVSRAEGLDSIRANLIADAREVFDASGPETPQSVRDVIEYVDSWLSVFAQKQSLAPSAPAQPSRLASLDRENRARGRELDRACLELPPGWEIRIDLERNAGTVYVIDPDGNESMMESGELFSDQIGAAIDSARKGEGGEK